MFGHLHKVEYVDEQSLDTITKFVYYHYVNSNNLTWRDVQYLIVHTSNHEGLTRYHNLSSPAWTQNGAGLWVSHSFGFGAIDAEAMVTRARHWINVPEQKQATYTPDLGPG